jgi:hypothetical protein
MHISGRAISQCYLAATLMVEAPRIKLADTQCLKQFSVACTAHNSNASRCRLKAPRNEVNFAPDTFMCADHPDKFPSIRAKLAVSGCRGSRSADPSRVERGETGARSNGPASDEIVW